MNTTLAILLAQSLSLIACILFAVWYVVPWLESRSRTEALVPLVWVHVMRNFALQLYSAQQAVSPYPTPPATTTSSVMWSA